MTDKQLQQIREQLTQRYGNAPIIPDIAVISKGTALALLDEVERLRSSISVHRNALQKCADDTDRLEAENAAMRGIVQVIGSGQIRGARLGDGECLFHDDCYPSWKTITPAPNETGYWRHEPDCPVTAAYDFMTKHAAKEQQPNGE